ncbi:penicillin-binding protein 2 [Hephaestia sp. GCM10023244]|uniref:penicillin-binding protein 2 n=1 Tax=unclassified Hephaestia TaxID=2631281 RepID=UPI002076E66A|nr:penicillin-binding protein 2 [Hephaestia sp. MAHUQ-44]MCM8731312.1 penicillin-binding protein 2 [Hephaestia sp. MAHUQ-44]
MNKPTRTINQAQQNFSFSRRAVVLGGAQAAVGIVLAGRMAWLAIAENEHYKLLSESNRINNTVIPPRRGWIIDRNGHPIADNRTDFRVDIIPDRLEDKDRTLALLQELLGLAPDDMARILADLKQAAGFQPVQVAENLPWERYAAISVRMPELPGVARTQGFARHYPAGAAVGHLTGYVGAASAEEYQKSKNPLLVTPGFKIGKDGLEHALEDRLRGKPGAKREEVTARGKLVRQLATRPDQPGDTVRLTIDAGLQEYTARRLGTNSGSAVVLDCLTGDVLAMCSMPSYDPNAFSDGISHLEWNMLSKNDHVPLMNKVLQGLYPPGSTVKPMNSLALLRNGIDPHQTVFCSGALKVGTGTFHCWRRRGHGHVDMRRAVSQSCDIYFYQMARELGYDAFAPTARELGMGQEFDIPFPSQRYGTVPDSAWKLKKYHTKWTVADSLNASIGQGYVLSNPLQLAVMAARIASGRKVVPRLILDQPHEVAPVLSMDQKHLAIVRDAMYATVNDGGTGGASRLYLPGIDVSAKTGTAQVRRITMAERRTGVLNNAALPYKLRDHALFISFAPSADPRYALAIVLEHNAHLIRNLDAPAIARDIYTYLYDRPRAIASLEAAEKTWGGDIATRMATDEAVYRAAHAKRIPAGTELDAAAPTSSAAVEEATAQADASAEAVANTHATGVSPAETGSPDAGGGGEAR